MFKNYLLGALCFLWAGVAVAQSDAYYWADGGRVALAVSNTHFIATAEDASTLSYLKPSGNIATYTSWPHKPYAVLEAAPNTRRDQMIVDFGVDTDELRISPGYALEDGFILYPTQTIVVGLRDAGDKDAMVKLADGFGVRSIEEKYGTYRIVLEDINQAIPAANRLQESGLVAYAQPDFYAPIERYQISDPLFSQQFQMNNTGQRLDGVTGEADADCNALEAWNISLGSAGTTVAVIDDGLENHEDFNTANGRSRYTAGFSPANNGNGNAGSGAAHGVACAGSITASHNNIGVRGVAPLANMISVNIFVGGESTQDIADGITWAKNQGADVMSNSWGYTSCTANFSNINRAIADANANGRGGLGCVIVFASGNGYKDCVDYPGRNPDVIAVGAIANTGVRSAYSNYGPALDIMAPSNNVGGPGAGVRTTDRMGGAGYTTGNYTGNFGGTSSACPVVSGVATLLLGYSPNLTSDQVKEILYTTATDTGPAGDDLQYAFGRVNALGALQASTGGGNPDPGALGQPRNLTVTDEQATEVSLSWAAPASGNVTGYEVYSDGTLLGTVGGTAATITGLSSCTNYTFGVRALGSAGNASAIATTGGSTTGCATNTGSPFTVGYFFESGYEGWADGGGDCARVNTTFSWEGNTSVRLRDNSGVASSMTSPAYDLAGLGSVELAFYFYSNSMEPGEDFFIRYNDGSGWQTVATYASGSSFDNGQFYQVSLTLNDSEYNLVDGGRFRIQCDASANADQIYVDEVTVTGALIAASTLSPISLIEPVGSPSISTTVVTPEAELTLFPNPAVDLVTVRATDAIQRVIVFDVQGREVLRRNYEGIETTSLDVSALGSGVYLFSVQTVESRSTERLVIKR